MNNTLWGTIDVRMHPVLGTSREKTQPCGRPVSRNQLILSPEYPKLANRGRCETTPKPASLPYRYPPYHLDNHYWTHLATCESIPLLCQGGLWDMVGEAFFFFLFGKPLEAIHRSKKWLRPFSINALKYKVVVQAHRRFQFHLKGREEGRGK